MPKYDTLFAARILYNIITVIVSIIISNSITLIIIITITINVITTVKTDRRTKNNLLYGINVIQQ